MKIVLSALGTRGDVQPMLALGLALRRRGHAVRMCAPPDFEDRVIDVGLPFCPVGQDVHEMMTVTCRDVVRKPLAPLRVLDEMIRSQFDDLRKACEGADVLVGAGIQAAAPSIAAALEIPYLYAAYCPVVLRSRQHPAPLVASQQLSGAVNLLSWWACERFFDFVLLSGLNRERRKLGLGEIRTIYDHLFKTRPTLLATDPILAPPPADARDGVVCTGFWYFEDEAELEPLGPELLAFLDAGAPPVYVGFGSMPSEDPERLTRQVVAAVKASGQRAILHRGWAGLGDVDLPEEIFLAGAVSHPKLFPRLAAVVHHGGAGTTANALRAGVPQVVVPHIVDQFYWASHVRRLGVGLPAPAMRKLDPEQLGRAIRTAAQSAGLRDRAREIAVQIDARSGLERAMDAVERARG
jgi:vancomycin aglycone glucosyltransferase